MPVETKLIQLEVVKDTDEVVDALVGIIESMKKAAADGFQLADVIAAGAENVSKLGIAVMGWENIPLGFKENLNASLNSLGRLPAAVAGALSK